MQNQFENKIAVVTGASTGIGACITKYLANSGMIVIGLARRENLINELNSEITNKNGKIIGKKCDVSDEKQILESFEWVKKNYGSIDVFINNAGIIKAAFLQNTETEDFKSLFDINVIATCICVRETLKLMQDNGNKGHIIILNSVLGQRIPDVPVPLFSVYPSTKYAISALCQTVRQEIRFQKLNIKLTSINPGMVDTNFLSVYGSSVYNSMPKLNPNDIAQAVMYALNTPDYVQIEDITLQAMFKHDS